MTKTKQVPLEPTEAMIASGLSIMDREGALSSVSEIYEAMLAAAQQEDPPIKLAPQAEGQMLTMLTMLITGDAGTGERGHWYSPEAVRKLLKDQRSEADKSSGVEPPATNLNAANELFVDANRYNPPSEANRLADELEEWLDDEKEANFTALVQLIKKTITALRALCPAPETSEADKLLKRWSALFTHADFIDSIEKNESDLVIDTKKYLKERG